MAEAAFLMPVQGVVGGVEIEDDLAGRRLVRDEEEIDEQPPDGRNRHGRSCGRARVRPARA